MKLKLTAAEVEPILLKIKESGQIVPDWFWKLPAEEIARAWNGVGSDLTPVYIRKGLTQVYGFAKEAVLIHDVIFSYKDEYNLGLEDFYEANKNLKINARICLAYKYSKWNQPYYSWCYGKAWLAEAFCNEYGLEAWVN